LRLTRFWPRETTMNTGLQQRSQDDVCRCAEVLYSHRGKNQAAARHAISSIAKNTSDTQQVLSTKDFSPLAAKRRSTLRRQRRPIGPGGIRHDRRKSNPHQFVQLSRCYAPVEEAEFAQHGHLAGSVEKTGHCGAIERSGQTDAPHSSHSEVSHRE
jgi:hypothetical protein